MKLRGDMASAAFPVVERLGRYKLMSWPLPLWVYQVTQVSWSGWGVGGRTGVFLSLQGVLLQCVHARGCAFGKRKWQRTCSPAPAAER
jgi:hypothetical protein